MYVKVRKVYKKWLDEDKEKLRRKGKERKVCRISIIILPDSHGTELS